MKNAQIKFIGLSGKKQVGKDTAGSILSDALTGAGYYVQMFPFAKPLKEICSTLFGINPALYKSEEGKNSLTALKWEGLPLTVREKYALETQKTVVYGMPGPITVQDLPVPRSGNMTVREVLQVIGTDIFREMVYNNVWAEVPFKQAWPKNTVVIMPDCRFPNEIEAVKSNNGIVIRLTRQTGLNDNHFSETALDNYTDFQYTYENDKSITELKEYLISILRKERLING